MLPELGPTRLDRDLQKYILNGKGHLSLKDLWEYLNRHLFGNSLSAWTGLRGGGEVNSTNILINDRELTMDSLPNSILTTPICFLATTYPFRQKKFKI